MTTSDVAEDVEDSIEGERRVVQEAFCTPF